MDKERNLGVTEARFALTLLTCLLVAIGYVALLRLGGTKDRSADVSADDTSPPSIAVRHTPPMAKLNPSRACCRSKSPRTGAASVIELNVPLPSQQSPDTERR